MIIMCMILSSPSRSAAPLKIGGSLMYLHATGTIPDPGKLEPYRPEETRVLAELHAEGVVKSLFRLSDRPGVYLIVEADDVEEARALVARHERKLPGSRVQAGQDGAVQRVAPAAVTRTRAWPTRDCGRGMSTRRSAS
jgi:muconolactone delta-isomerase